MGAAYSNLVRTIALNSIRNELALSPLERLHFLLILCQANQHCLSLDLAWGLKDSSSSMINPRTLDCVVYSMVFVPILRVVKLVTSRSEEAGNIIKHSVLFFSAKVNQQK